MTEKQFMALADAIRYHNLNWHLPSQKFNRLQRIALANFCETQNPNFNKKLWLNYIAGKCGPRGEKL